MRPAAHNQKRWLWMTLILGMSGVLRVGGGGSATPPGEYSCGAIWHTSLCWNLNHTVFSDGLGLGIARSYPDSQFTGAAHFVFALRGLRSSAVGNSVDPDPGCVGVAALIPEAAERLHRLHYNVSNASIETSAVPRAVDRGRD